MKKRPVSDVEAYTTGRMGDQEGTFCNPKAAANIVRFYANTIIYVHRHILRQICFVGHWKQEAYTEAAKVLHGPEFDVMNSPLDKVAVYKAGGGKKHGRYLIGDGFINTLSEVRASNSGSQNDVHTRRYQHAYTPDTLLEQEIAARKILEEKLNNQMEITNCLKDGYAALALVILM